MRGNLGVSDVRWHRASLWQPGRGEGQADPDDGRSGQQRKHHAMSAGIGPASGSLDGDEPYAGSRRLKQRDEYSQNSRSAFVELLDGEKDQQKMTESSSSEQPRVTQSAAESGGATPQDHTGSRHVSFEIGPLDEKIEEFVGGDHAPSIVPTGPAVKGTTLGEAQECV